MTWEILLTISIVAYSISVLLQRVLLKDVESDPVAYSVLFQLVVGAIIAIVAIAQGFILPDFSVVFPNVLLMIILYALANIFIFKALKRSEASEYTILFSTRVIWTVLAAVLFLGETFSFSQVIGTILIVSSIALVSWKKGSVKLGDGALFSLLGACFLGLAFANDAYIIAHQETNIASYLVIAFALPALAVLAVYPKSIKKMRPLLQKTMLSKLMVLSVFYAVSALTVFKAYQIGQNAAQIGALNNLTTIVIVLLSVIFLKEKSNLERKLIGAGLSFIGMMLI